MGPGGRSSRFVKDGNRAATSSAEFARSSEGCYPNDRLDIDEVILEVIALTRSDAEEWGLMQTRLARTSAH